MIVRRVEKHIIKYNSPYYHMFCDFTHKSKNLYNHANYIVRNEFINNGKWVRYNDLDKILKADLEFDDQYELASIVAPDLALGAQFTIQIRAHPYGGGITQSELELPSYVLLVTHRLRYRLETGDFSD